MRQSGCFCSPGNALTGAKACAGAEESSHSALPEVAKAAGQAARTRRTWPGTAEAVEPPGSGRGDSTSASVLSARQHQGRWASRAPARPGLLLSGCLPVGARRRGRQPASPGPGDTSGRHRARYGMGAGGTGRASGEQPRRRPTDPGPAQAEKSAGPRGRSERAAGQRAVRAEGGTWAAPGLPAPAVR